MFGQGLGAGMGAGTGAPLNPALMGNPMVATPPPVTPAPTPTPTGAMANHSLDPLSIIMHALKNPEDMAHKMALSGISPQDFKAALDQNQAHLANVMQPQTGASQAGSSMSPQPSPFDSHTDRIFNPPSGATKGEGANTAPSLADLMEVKDKSEPSVKPQEYSFVPGQDEGMFPVGGYKEPATADNFITPQTLWDFFRGGSGVNKGATGAYLGNNPAMVPGGTVPPGGGPKTQLPIAPPVQPPVQQEKVSPLPHPDDLAPMPPTVASMPPKALEYYSGAPNHQIPPLVGEQPNRRAAELETRSMTPEMREFISNEAKAGGIDPNYMLRMAVIESGGNPKAYNEGSKASGLYQFIPGTAKQYGLKDPFDWKANTQAAVKLAQDNKAYLEKVLGREPSNAELYLAHQQGMKGAADLILNRDRPAADVVGQGAVTSNGGKAAMSAGQFVDMWENKYNEPSIGGGSGGGKGEAGAAGGGDTIAGGSGNNSLGAAGDSGAAAANAETPGGSLNPKMMAFLAAMQDAADTMSKTDMNLPKAPSPVAPSHPQQYDPNAQVKQLFLSMLYGGGGGQAIPSLGALMGR
jgi:hypothetical protein